MRTSASQFQLLVDFMERYGDLSKPTEGPQGRSTNFQRWAELTQMLNADATGDTKTSEKWRKVWSDYKNNTKKKAAKIYRSAQATGGGPASNLRLSDLEQRVLTIVGTQAATGIVTIPEIGIEEEVIEPLPEANVSINIQQLDYEQDSTTVEVWNCPGTSAQPALFPSILVADECSSEVRLTSGTEERGQPMRDERDETGLTGVAADSPIPPTSARHRPHQRPMPLPLTPRRRRRGRLHEHTSPAQRRTRTQTQSDLARQAFVRSDCEWRAFQQETERERNRLREEELRMQERWLQLFGQFLLLSNRVVDIIEKKLD